MVSITRAQYRVEFLSTFQLLLQVNLAFVEIIMRELHVHVLSMKNKYMKNSWSQIKKNEKNFWSIWIELISKGMRRLSEDELMNSAESESSDIIRNRIEKARKNTKKKIW